MQTTYTIVGSRFRPPAEDVLAQLPAGTKLFLRRQPDNPYDSKAVSVMLNWEDDDDLRRIIVVACEEISASIPDGPLHLGYIPAKENREISLYMDSHGDLPCSLTFAPWGGPQVTLD